MQYCSPLYLACFLPITLLIYGIVPKKKRWIVLLLASYLFFFLISGKLIVYLLFITLSVHHFGLWLERINQDKNKELDECDKELKKEVKKKYQNKTFRIVLMAVFIHIGLLIILKYSTFLGTNINTLLRMLNINYQITIPKILMPIGISFYTLQALSYIFDVYKGNIEADKNLGRLALFMAFFPSIMEGPIVRYKDTAVSLYEGNDVTYKNVTFGTQRILWGIMKKLVVADRLNCFIKCVFSGYASFDGGLIFFGALCYTIQLYMEFSGTMDIVIGSAEMFGIKMPENFNAPFFSKNISEFWTRWHITLGAWFKDYIFYPLSLSKPMKKLTLIARKRLGNHFGSLLVGTIALFVVWLCNGLWHGAAWMYIFFGLYHFILIVAGNVFTPMVIKVTNILHIKRSSFGYKLMQMIKTSFLVVIGELFFRADGLKAGLESFRKIITEFSFSSFKNNLVFSLGADRQDFIIVGIILVIVLVISVLKERKINVREWIGKQNVVIRWSLYYALILIVIIFGAYGPGYDPVDPIYANF